MATRFAAAPLALLLSVACASNVERDALDATAPTILALSTYRASVGEVIRVVGADFAEDATHTLLVQGIFEGDDGVRQTVGLSEPVRRIDDGALAWERFGPHDQPFSRLGPRAGVFRGDVSIRSERDDGTVVVSEPLPIDFEVAPSLIVRDFQPTMASCAAPATLALAEIPYRLEVEAVGFQPVQFNYVLVTPTLEGTEPIVQRHLSAERTDVIGDRDDIVLPAVPDDVSHYDLVVIAEARGADGEMVRSSFSVEVHRPIEVYYNGNVEIAEILPPQPVSACIPGGEIGRAVTYNETQVETRMRGYDIGWNESWRASHSVSEGSSATIGASTTNGVGFGISSSESIGWSVGSEISTEFGASGSFGVSKLVEVGVSAKLGLSQTTTRSGTRTAGRTASQNRTEGVNASRTTTRTETETAEQGGGRSEGFEWSVSSSDSVARGFGGTVLPGHYGVFFRQTMRLVRRAALVSYNLCGVPEVVGEVDFTDWTWAADLGVAQSCPPLPRSNLPEAVCYEPPCAE